MLKKNSTEQTGDRETNSTFHLICTTLCTFTPSFIQRNLENNGNSRCTLFPDLCTSNELVSCRSRMNESYKPNKRYLQVTNMSKVIRKYGEI